MILSSVRSNAGGHECLRGLQTDEHAREDDGDDDRALEPRGVNDAMTEGWHDCIYGSLWRSVHDGLGLTTKSEGMNPKKELDAALDALFYTLDQVPELDTGGRVACLRARVHHELSRFKGRLVCDQDFKPRAEALEEAGWKVSREIQGAFPLVLVLPERQKQMTLGDLARGWDLVETGGVLVCSLPNDWGAKRFEGHLAEATGNKETISKNRCRVFWSSKEGTANEEILSAWRDGLAFQKILNGRFWSRPGLFSWDRADAGSQLLAAHLPTDIAGHVADLGVGWGHLSDHLLRHHPQVLSLDCYDADAMALEAAKRNLANVKSRAKTRFHWRDVTRPLDGPRYDFIVMNPPFHEARQPDPTIGVRFIANAALALKDGGHLWLVANRHLPYERMMSEAFQEWSLVAESDGFKVMTGTKPNRVETR
jgi:16S rRNA (guanine1207-N2)-methyltransferase